MNQVNLVDPKDINREAAEKLSSILKHLRSKGFEFAFYHNGDHIGRGSESISIAFFPTVTHGTFHVYSPQETSESRGRLLGSIYWNQSIGFTTDVGVVEKLMEMYSTPEGCVLLNTKELATSVFETLVKAIPGSPPIQEAIRETIESFGPLYKRK